MAQQQSRAQQKQSESVSHGKALQISEVAEDQARSQRVSARNGSLAAEDELTMAESKASLETGDLKTENELLRATCAQLERRLISMQVQDASLKWDLAQKTKALETETARRSVAEKAMLFSRKQLRALLDASSDVLFRMSADFSRLYHLIGRDVISDVHQPTASWLERFIPPSERHRVALTLRRAIRDKSAFELEHKVVLKDGSRGHVRTRVVPLLDENGEISEWLGLATNVTPAEIAKQELERLNLLMREGERIAQLGSWEYTTATGEMTWSDGLRRIYGIARDQPLPNYREVMRRYLPPEEAMRMIGALHQAVATGTALDLEHRILQPDGTERTVQELALPRFDPAGRVLSYAGVTRDITESKRAEDRLRASERRFRELFENLPIAYHSTDNQGRWIDANLEMAELLGFDSPVEMLGLSFLDYWDFNAEHYDRNLARFHQAGQVDFELCLRKRDGSPLTVLAAFRRQLDATNLPLRTHSLLIDITERRLKEDEIRALNQDLERRVARRTAEAVAANNAKSEFLAQMSHEIRTPLHIILGSAQILAKDRQLNAPQRQQLGQIEDAGETLLGLLTDILDFSKIEAGKVSITTQPVNVVELLKRIESQSLSAANDKGLSFRIHYPDDPGLGVLGDPLRIQQVLTNLIGNAIKFTESGGIVIDAESRKTGEQNGNLRFVVQDSGIGIETHAIERLFQPFNQCGPSNDRCSDGAGLGLVISKRLVELMDGQIGVWSQPGQGSRFWFELPLTDGLEAVRGRPTEPISVRLADRQDLKDWHLLVVDDSALSRQVMMQALQQYGARATLVGDGHQALHALRQSPDAFQAVLMDVRMPGLDGLSATREIRRAFGRHQLPVIGISAGALAYEEEAALSAGMNAVLAKPVRFDELVITILRYTRTEKVRNGDRQVDTDRVGPAIAQVRHPTSEASYEEADPTGGQDPKGGRSVQHPTEETSNRQAMRERLLKLFRAESEGVQESLRQELAAGDRKGAVRRLHKLRGAACMIGAQELIELSGNLETAVALGETDLAEAIARLGKALADLGS
jgi:PAS domain S-box-containing protein